MRKSNIIVICLLLSVWSGIAQIDQQQFFVRVNSIYYQLNQSGIKNFSSWINSDYFNYSTKDIIKDSEYYPLDFIWVNPGQMFFIKRAAPDSSDSTGLARVSELQIEMQQALKGIFIDWQRFIGGNLLYDISTDYKLEVIDDTVHIDYQTEENGRPILLRFYFGINGLCFKVVTTYPEIQQKVLTYPKFLLIQDKWICNGWEVQIVEGDEISSGFAVSLKSKKIEGYWLPVQIELRVQIRKEPNKTFTRLFTFKNIRINRDIKVLDN